MGPKYEVKYISKFYFLKNKLPNFKLEKKIFFQFFPKDLLLKKYEFFFNFGAIFLKKILWETFCFINRHVKHTFVHSDYVEVALGLAEHIPGQDLMHRPLPADIIWLEFGSFSNFLRKKVSFIQKMADLANLAGRLADVADFIWSALTSSFQKNLKSRVISKTHWDNAIFVTALLADNQRNPQINGAIL